MTQKQGLINFAQNIRELMLKCKQGKRLHKDEKRTLVEFYLEVIDYLSKA